jgi:hypothetical protein
MRFCEPPDKRQRGYRAMGYRIRELTPESAGMEFSTTANDDKQYRTEHYNLPAAGIDGGA